MNAAIEGIGPKRPGLPVLSLRTELYNGYSTRICVLDVRGEGEMNDETIAQLRIAEADWGDDIRANSQATMHLELEFTKGYTEIESLRAGADLDISLRAHVHLTLKSSDEVNAPIYKFQSEKLELNQREPTVQRGIKIYSSRWTNELVPVLYPQAEPYDVVQRP